MKLLNGGRKMLYYKDMTFCNRSDCPKWDTCERAYTDKVSEEADKFGLPCSMMSPSEAPCDMYCEEK